MSAPVTQWFSGRGLRPKHKGVYEVNSTTHTNGQRIFQYWDGNFMGCYANSAKAAEESKFYAPSLFQHWDWRGLADKPATPPESKP